MSTSAMPDGVVAGGIASAPWARAVCAGISSVDCKWVVYVPDNPLAHVLQTLADEHPKVRTILATREEEAFGIAAGLYLGGFRSAVLLQSSGLGNSLNAIGSLLIAYHIPSLIVMSMRGGPGEWNEAQVPLGRAVPSILDALGVQHTSAGNLDGAEDAVRLAGSLAFGTRSPAACLLLRSLTASGSRFPRPAIDPRDAAALVHDVIQPLKPGRTLAMNRLEATRVFARHLRNEAVICTLGHPAYDLFVARDRPENFYTWGSMGMASSIGLGVALAQPDRRVIVCDGDGSLLMNLGSLATIALARPANLTIVVWDNGEYGTTGGQRSATAAGADLAGAASALGLRSATTVYTSDALALALDRSAGEPGPTIIVAKVAESEPTAKPPLDCVFLKHRFMSALGTREPATQGGA
jgi:sulfopyruvate decarboxylase alpha subunit